MPTLNGHVYTASMFTKWGYLNNPYGLGPLFPDSIFADLMTVLSSSPAILGGALAPTSGRVPVGDGSTWQGSDTYVGLVDLGKLRVRDPFSGDIASHAGFSHDGGDAAQFWAWGHNAATVGLFQFMNRSSDGSLGNILATLGEAGGDGLKLNTWQPSGTSRTVLRLEHGASYTAFDETRIEWTQSGLVLGRIAHVFQGTTAGLGVPGWGLRFYAYNGTDGLEAAPRIEIIGDRATTQFQGFDACLLDLNTTHGTTADYSGVRYSRGGTLKWVVGNNTAGANADLFSVYNGSLGVDALQIRLADNKVVGAALVSGQMLGIRDRVQRYALDATIAASSTKTFTFTLSGVDWGAHVDTEVVAYWSTAASISWLKSSRTMYLFTNVLGTNVGLADQTLGSNAANIAVAWTAVGSGNQLRLTVSNTHASLAANFVVYVSFLSMHTTQTPFPT